MSKVYPVCGQTEPCAFYQVGSCACAHSEQAASPPPAEDLVQVCIVCKQRECECCSECLIAGRLKSDLRRSADRIAALQALVDRRDKEIDELFDERDALQAEATKLEGYLQQSLETQKIALARADRIERETIERCAVAAESVENSTITAREMVKAIRALAQPKEGEE